MLIVSQTNGLIDIDCPCFEAWLNNIDLTVIQLSLFLAFNHTFLYNGFEIKLCERYGEGVSYNLSTARFYSKLRMTPTLSARYRVQKRCLMIRDRAILL